MTDIGPLGLTYTKWPARTITVDWRRTEHGRRWRLMLGTRQIWYPMGMPPKRRGRLLGVTYSWYPKGYEPVTGA